MPSWSYDGSTNLSVTFPSTAGHTYRLSAFDPNSSFVDVTASGSSTTVTVIDVGGMDSTEYFAAFLTDLSAASPYVDGQIFQFGVASGPATSTVTVDYDGADTITLNVPSPSGHSMFAQVLPSIPTDSWTGDGSTMTRTLDISGRGYSAGEGVAMYVQDNTDPGVAGATFLLATVFPYGTPVTSGPPPVTSTQDCMTAEAVLGDASGGVASMGDSNDLSTVYESILVNDNKLYFAFEFDYYDTPATPAGPHYTYRVGSINTDGTGLTTHVVEDHANKDIDSYPGENAVHAVGGGFAGAGAEPGGQMALVYDGSNVILATLTKEGHSGGGAFTRYYVNIYREDAGAWTKISTIVSQDSVGGDTFQSFRLTASPTVPGTAWLGMMGTRFVGGGLLEDRFTRYEIDLATGTVTTLHDDFNQAATLAALVPVGAANWDLVSDDGYPILIWETHTSFDDLLSDDFETRYGWNNTISVERFDTKAAIRTITIQEACHNGTLTDAPLRHANTIDADGLRNGRWLRAFGRFLCSETGQYERFVSAAGWPSSSTRYIFRIRSDFSSTPRQIDSPGFLTSPGAQGFTHEQFAWGAPLYDGARNVWVLGADEVNVRGRMLQLDRRCTHNWLQADSYSFVVPVERGGWDSDLYYYTVAHDFSVMKLGPVTRDCVICTPVAPAVSGLFADVTF